MASPRFQEIDFEKLNLPSLLIHSDLHLETGGFTLAAPANKPAVAIFAGDAHNGTKGMALLRAMSDLPTVVVAGNHEFWGGDYFETLADLRVSGRVNKLHFLENEAVVLHGVRFLGATLWTDYHGGRPELMHYGLWNMRDHRHIRAEKWWTSVKTALFKNTFGQHALASFEGQFNPLLQRELHAQSKLFLAKASEQEFQGPTVVITHHAPTPQSLRRSGTPGHALNPENWTQRRHDDLNLTKVGSYASPVLELDQLAFTPKSRRVRTVKDLGVVLWAHGHIHHGLDFGVGGLRVVCNPRGRVLTPLTQADAESFAMLGYPLAVGAIEASVAAHAANPENGDSFDYAPLKVVDLADSCYFWIESEHKVLAQELTEISCELNALRSTARSCKVQITDLVAYRVDGLRTRAIAKTRLFLNMLLIEFKPHYAEPDTDLRNMLVSAKLIDYADKAVIENICNFEQSKSWRTEKDSDPRIDSRNHLRQVALEVKLLIKTLAAVPAACSRLKQDYWFSATF